MKILLVGFGRMGRLVEELARDDGHEIVARIVSSTTADDLPAADVAIDFSTAEAVGTNLPRLAERGVNMVIGTTGWQSHERELRAVAERAGVGVVAAANFSIGVNVFAMPSVHGGIQSCLFRKRSSGYLAKSSMASESVGVQRSASTQPM